MFINLLALAVVLALLFGVWGGIHLLARNRMGDRPIGCRGPQVDERGNTVCCNDNSVPCEAVEEATGRDS